MSVRKKIIGYGITAMAIAIVVILATPILQLGPPSVLGQGTLSILITDPPHVPEGVTSVYITYSDLAVHVARAGNESGWTVVKSQGEIDLMQTLNVSQTIASVNIATGVYNLIRFNISSALVTFEGENYTAFVPSSMLKVPIIGGIEVNDTKPSATIIDISPAVFNIGSPSNPEFIIRPAAKAYAVPSTEVSKEIEHEGWRFSLMGKGWWKHIRQNYTANLEVTEASLTADSLSVTVENTGNQSTKILTVTVTPLASAIWGGHRYGMRMMPKFLYGSAMFVVESNGTLVSTQEFMLSIRGKNYLGEFGREDFGQAIIDDRGYNLDVEDSKTFTYSGQISLNLRARIHQQGVVPGQQYLITVVGQEALASMVVIAG